MIVGCLVTVFLHLFCKQKHKRFRNIFLKHLHFQIRFSEAMGDGRDRRDRDRDRDRKDQRRRSRSRDRSSHKKHKRSRTRSRDRSEHSRKKYVSFKNQMKHKVNLISRNCF